MWPDGVVVAGEGVELRLEPADGGRSRLAGEPFLERLMEPFDLAAGLWVIRAGMAEHDAPGVEGDLERDPATAA